jgi:hypothetical protein
VGFIVLVVLCRVSACESLEGAVKVDGLDWGVLSIEAISCEVLVLIESVNCIFCNWLCLGGRME